MQGLVLFRPGILILPHCRSLNRVLFRQKSRRRMLDGWPTGSAAAATVVCLLPFSVEENRENDRVRTFD